MNPVHHIVGMGRMLLHGQELLAALRSPSDRSIMTDREHMLLAGEWLLAAQQANADNGYAHSYSLHNGWERSYPETTGYIIPTMLELGRRLRDERFRVSALRAGVWLLSKQLKDGAFPDLDGRPQVFDTGQIIEGLLSLHAETGEQSYLASAIHAGEFLIGCQDTDGSWTSHSYHNLPHTYYTRVAANLLRLAKSSGNGRFADAGRNNLAWALKHQSPNGYFSYMSFLQNDDPILHTIVYVLEGLLDAHVLTGDERYLAAIRVTAGKLVEINKERDYILFAQYNDVWRHPRAEHCTVGLAQWSRLLLNLHALAPNNDLPVLAGRTIDWLKSRQVLLPGAAIHGAIPGSVPVWGSYFRFAFNNWTVKFFLDALLLREQIFSERTPAH